MMSDVKLSRTWVTVGPCRSYLENIIYLTKSKISSYVCFANPHALVAACEHAASKQVIDSADIVTIFMDNQYVAKKSKQYQSTNLLFDILEEAEKNHFSIFLYGPTEEVIDLIIARVQKDFPLLEIAGYYAPPFRPLTKEEDCKITDTINASGAHMVLVSLSFLEQERWMYKHKGRIHSCMLGLGQAIYTYIGLEKKSSKWSLGHPFRWLNSRVSFSVFN